MTDDLREVKNADVKIIATTNVTSKGEPFEFTFNRAPLLELSEDFKDNSFLMLIKILKAAGVKNLYCAGLDGYSTREQLLQSQDGVLFRKELREISESSYA